MFNSFSGYLQQWACRSFNSTSIDNKEKVNLPSGVLNLVQGGRKTGKALVEHPSIQGLCFTGSYSTDRYLSELFGKDLSKILALELGGNNPLVIQLIRVKNFEEAIREANNTRFGLAAGLFSQSIHEYHSFYSHVQARIINWNTQLTEASNAASFGGIKWSGNHRPSALYAADYCSYPVASFESPELQMPPQLSPGINFS